MALAGRSLGILFETTHDDAFDDGIDVGNDFAGGRGLLRMEWSFW